MKRTRYIDVVMTVPPGPHGEFVETEDDQGCGVGADRGLSWVPPTGEDPYWRLRIPAKAHGGNADLAGGIAFLLMCLTIVCIVWLVTR